MKSTMKEMHKTSSDKKWNLIYITWDVSNDIYLNTAINITLYDNSYHRGVRLCFSFLKQVKSGKNGQILLSLRILSP